MAYLLLFAESLAVSLLLVATIAAWTARWRFRGLRALVMTLVQLAGLTVYGGLTALAAMVNNCLGNFAWGLLAAATLTGGFLIGTFLIYRRGLRRRDGIASAETWPRGTLALALMMAAGLHVLTFWVMDLSIRQQAGSMRAKATAMVLSVSPPQMADRDNAAFDCKLAYEAFGSYEDLPDEYDEKWTSSLGANAVDPKDAKLRAFLGGKAEALRLVRRGATKRGCWVEIGSDPTDPFSKVPILLSAQALAELLGLSARFRAADGDANGAVEDFNAMVPIGEGVGMRPELVQILAGMRIDDLTFETMQSLADGGKLTIADLARLRVDGSLSWHRQFQRAMVMEEAYRLGILAGVAEGRLSLTDLRLVHRQGRELSASWPVDLAYRIFLLPQDVDDNARFSAELRDAAAMQYPQAAAGWKKLEAESAASLQGLIVRQLIPRYAQASSYAAEADARRAAAGTAVAACRYRIARGQWPDKLDDLVPAYLIVSPIDPFDGKPLRWKSGGEKIVIYSVGPDGKDDGGAAYDSKAKTGDIVFELRK